MRARRERFLKDFRSPQYRPPTLPKVATEFMQLYKRENVGLRDVVALLEQDPLIAARVLRMAQSPMYSRGHPVRSLEQAATRLGLNTLGDVVWAVAMESKVFKSKNYAGAMEQVRRHSLASAHIARAVCGRTGVDAEYAFLCGLLHDLGIAALLVVMDQNTTDTFGGEADIWVAIDPIHAEAGAIVAGMWSLPEDVALALEYHHTPTSSTPMHPLAAGICIADALASEVGLGITPLERLKLSIDESEQHEYDAAVQALGLTEASLEALRLEAATLEIE